jgi:hypothetical protein
MEPLKIEVVEWNKIPEGEWQNILTSITVGGCVKTLPYNVHSGCVSLRFAVGSGHFDFKADDSCEVDLPSMQRLVEFTKLIKLDGSVVAWKRTQ